MPDNKCLKILELIRTLQRRNRFISSAGEAPFSPTESHIIVETDINPGISPADLSRLLQVQRSTISRALKSLENKNFIDRHPHQNRKRGYGIYLSEDCQSKLPHWDLLASERLRKLTSELDQAELIRLAEHLNCLSTGLGTPESKNRESEFLLRASIRRLTRGAGLLNDNFMRVGISSSCWQILESIADLNQSSTQEIANYLRVARSTASLLIGKLHKKGYVGRTIDFNDKRRTILTLTEAGVQKLSRIRSEASQTLKKALVNFSTQEIDDFINLFSCLYKEKPSSHSSTDINLSRLSSEKDKQNSRGWVLRQLVMQNLENQAPARILYSPFCFQLNISNNPAGFIEIQRTAAPGKWELRLMLNSDRADTFMVAGLLKFSMEIFFLEQAAASVILPLNSALVPLEISNSQQTASITLNARNWNNKLQNVRLQKLAA